MIQKYVFACLSLFNLNNTAAATNPLSITLVSSHQQVSNDHEISIKLQVTETTILRLAESVRSVKIASKMWLLKSVRPP